MKLPITLLALTLTANVLGSPMTYTLLSPPEKAKVIRPLTCATVDARNAKLISTLAFYKKTRKTKLTTDHLAARTFCYLSPSCKSLGMVGTSSGIWTYKHCSATGSSCVTRYFPMSAKAYVHAHRKTIADLLKTLRPLGWKAGVHYRLAGGCKAFTNTSGNIESTK